MAYEKGQIRDTYLAKAKWDVYGDFYREMVTLLSDFYDKAAYKPDGVTWTPFITADAAGAQDLMDAINDIFNDLDALYYPSRP